MGRRRERREEHSILKIAFDIGGVISKYPQQMREVIWSLKTCGHETHVITDMHDKEDVLKQLKDNEFEHYFDFVHCADYATHGELCKAVLLRDIKIDMFYDDFVGYTMWPPHFGPAPIRMLVMPDGYRPYWHPDWRCSGGDFGRRVYKGE